MSLRHDPVSDVVIKAKKEFKNIPKIKRSG